MYDIMKWSYIVLNKDDIIFASEIGAYDDFQRESRGIN